VEVLPQIGHDTPGHGARVAGRYPDKQLGCRGREPGKVVVYEQWPRRMWRYFVPTGDPCAPTFDIPRSKIVYNIC
jgi:hypothetical protein